MKLRTNPMIVAAVVVLAVASVVVMSRFGIQNLSQREVTGLSSYLDVSYGADPAQRFDIYVPRNGTAQLPLIIFVHGGAWIAGDKDDVSAIAVFLANQRFVVINMNYRLLPAFSYPAPMEDIQAVLQWVKQHSEQYRIDTIHIGMSGHSAGGHLVALYALTQDKNYTAHGSTLPKVYAIAPMAGGYTLEGINITSARREDTIIEWLKTADPQSLGLPIDQIDNSDNVSFLLLHGAQDVNSPPSQSSLFYGALAAQGVPVLWLFLFHIKTPPYLVTYSIVPTNQISCRISSSPIVAVAKPITSQVNEKFQVWRRQASSLFKFTVTHFSARGPLTGAEFLRQICLWCILGFLSFRLTSKASVAREYRMADL